MLSKTSYTKIAAKIIFATMGITLACAIGYGEYMKKEAIVSLAHVDAKKTSMLVFESLYAAMERGWNKDDLGTIITRLNRIDDKMKIDVYRSQIVAQRFGEIAKDKAARESDPDVAHAMRGEETLRTRKANYIDYYYPVTANSECLRCHTNASAGKVLGVIHVAYPIEDLKVSMTRMINFSIFFLVIFSIIVYAAIFFELKRYLIMPIRNFASAIQAITASRDIKRRVEVNDNIEEIDSIKDVFNAMLDAIERQFYYDPLTGLENRRCLSEKLEEARNVS